MKSRTSARSFDTIGVVENGRALSTARLLAAIKSTDRTAQNDIPHRAYAIWEGEGHPENHQLSNWLEAEAESQLEQIIAAQPIRESVTATKYLVRRSRSSKAASVALMLSN